MCNEFFACGRKWESCSRVLSDIQFPYLFSNISALPHLYYFLVTIFNSKEEGEMIEILNEVFSFCESNEIKLRFHMTITIFFSSNFFFSFVVV